MPRQEEYDINELLLQCKQSASYGYELASDYAARLNRTLMDAENSIADAVNTFSESSVYDSAATGLLEQQLMDIRASFNQLSLAYNYDLSMLKKNAAYFTITLFGRTEAGKSTLMEVLKHGDGKSIGKGAQRTTRNVRKYKWNNLLIKDVPGIAAFGGQEDESIAFEAAKSADLVLFLITDDGPQAAEIECFSRIINLGKPVICIMNVKHSIDEDDIEMSIDDIKDCFDFDRLNEIKQEFFSYGDELGSGWRWKKIPFV